MDVVSRGGSFITGWMLHNDAENPLYEYYDEILDVCEEYDVTISLGDGLRPGCLADATDRAHPFMCLDLWLQMLLLVTTILPVLLVVLWRR